MKSKEVSMYNFILLFSGQMISLLGSTIVRFALIWWLTQTTGSVSVLAYASLVFYLPDIFVSPFAGVFIDRWSKKKIMIFSNSLVSVAILILLLLYLQGNMAIWQVYSLLFLGSLGGSFHWISMQASVSMMVPKDQLQRVSGLNQGVQGAINIVGPPLAAIILAFLSLKLLFAINILTAVFAIVILCFVDIPDFGTRKSPLTFFSILSNLHEGLIFLIRWNGLMYFILIIMLVHVVAIPSISFFPLLVTEFFGGNINFFSVLESTFSGGIALGGIFLSLWGGFKRKTDTILTSLLCSGFGCIIICIVPGVHFLITLIGVFIFSFTISIVSSSISALQQSIIPIEMQGRVFALVRSLTSAMPSVGLAIAAPFSEVIGIRSWYIFGGLFIVVLSLIGFYESNLKKIENISKPGTHN